MLLVLLLIGNACQVNMASQMESTGLPERIQISEAYRDALKKHYPEFKATTRGKVEIKVSFFAKPRRRWCDGNGVG